MSSAIINGTTVDFTPDETILAAANRAGVRIPTLCHDDRLAPEGGCRMCLVHCEGQERPVAACHTGLREGMVVRTEEPDLQRMRATLLSMYEACGDHTGFRAATGGRFAELGGRVAQTDEAARAAEVESSHPYLRFRADACITCRLCLNVCEQVQGQFVYGIGGRGPDARLLIGPTDRFADSPCVACGACVDICPTGALSDRDRMTLNGSGTARTSTVCGYCGVGCRLDVEVKNDRVTRIDAVADAAVNRGHLCVKGRYAHNWQTSPERLTKPLLREADGGFREAEWDEALSFIARRLSEIRAQSGPEALGALTSSRSTNEACYLLQKLFRAVVGGNNVDCCARVCHSSTAMALQLVTGTGAATASYQDLEKARCLVVAGANPTEAHPVVGARIKQAALRGTPLVVIDPRRIELAHHADIHLQLHPGTNVALFNGLAKVLLEEGFADDPYLAARTEGLEALKEFLGALDLAEVARVTTVPEERIRAAARLIGSSGPTLFVHGLGLSELMQGVASVMTWCNLGMITGSIGLPGAGMLPLRGQNNVQGSADMGSMPTHFTGYQPLADAGARERIGRIWGSLPPEQPGMTSTMMLRAAAAGNLRGLWLMGEDIAQSDPHESEVLKALDNLDLLIVQDLFFCETARHAHVVLPSCGFLEQDGTFTNGERRIQRVRAAVPTPGEARPDWLQVVQVANLMGAQWSYPSPAAVMDEIAAVAPGLFGGIGYDRLGPDGLQWPCPNRSHPGTSTVHADGFMLGRGRLMCIDYEASPEHDVDGYPYTLVTGRVLEHYNVGTMTRRGGLAELVPADLLEIHPEDAAREGLGDGSEVGIESRWGRIRVPLSLSPRIAPGTLFLTFHYPETHANRLTGPTIDPKSNCPQYKATAVRFVAL